MIMHLRGRLDRRLVVSLAVAAAIVLTQGCSRDSGAVGKAGSVEVQAKDVRAIVDSMPEATQAALRKDRAALEQVVRGELLRRNLLEAAREARLESDPKIAEQLARAQDDALVQAWLAKQAKVADDYPSEQELTLAYQSNAAALTPPPQYRVAQIFIAAPNGSDPSALAAAMRKAAEVGSRIPGGDFAALAREYSEHAGSAAQGGDVGLLPANQLLPEIAAVVGNLAVGDTIGPIKTSQGLHYLKLLDKKASVAPAFEAVQEQLRAALRARRAKELEQAYLAQLNAKLKVSVDQIALAQLEPTEK